MKLNVVSVTAIGLVVGGLAGSAFWQLRRADGPAPGVRGTSAAPGSGAGAATGSAPALAGRAPASAAEGLRAQALVPNAPGAAPAVDLAQPGDPFAQLAGAGDEAMGGLGVRKPAAGDAGTDEAGEGDEAEPTDAGVGIRFSPDREGIQAAVRESRPKLRECYEGWLKTDGKLGGTLKLTFTIAPPKPGESPEGGDAIAVIRDVAVMHSELGNMAMEGCALNAMTDLQFDAPEAEMVVNYPLVFEADSGDEAAEAPAP